MTKLSVRDARKRLEAAIAAAGTASAYAARLGVSDVLISDMRHGRRYISGVVADDLGLKRIVSQTISYLEEKSA